MAIERTFSIIKPDATRRNITGAINTYFEKSGLRIVAQKRMYLSRRQAGLFYAVHKDRPFFDELVEFMVSAPVKNTLPPGCAITALCAALRFVAKLVGSKYCATKCSL